MSEHPVFTHVGDATAAAEALVEGLAAEHGSREAAGLHKLLFVSRARMTVVMVTHPDSPLARALRARSEWKEPQSS